MHQKIIDTISKETKDNFIILSTHDDIDVLVDGYYKYRIINIFNENQVSNSINIGLQPFY